MATLYIHRRVPRQRPGRLTIQPLKSMGGALARDSAQQARISFQRENDGVGPYEVVGANAVLYSTYLDKISMRVQQCVRFIRYVRSQ